MPRNLIVRGNSRVGITPVQPDLGEAARGAASLINIMGSPERRRKENLLFNQQQDEYRQTQEDRDRKLRAEKLNFALDLLEKVTDDDSYKAALDIYSRMYGDEDLGGFPLEYNEEGLEKTINFLQKYKEDPEEARKSKEWKDAEQRKADAATAAEERKAAAATSAEERKRKANLAEEGRKASEARAAEERKESAFTAEQRRKDKAAKAKLEREAKEKKEKGKGGAKPVDLDRFQKYFQAEVRDKKIDSVKKNMADEMAKSVDKTINWEKDGKKWKAIGISGEDTLEGFLSGSAPPAKKTVKKTRDDDPLGLL